MSNTLFHVPTIGGHLLPQVGLCMCALGWDLLLSQLLSCVSAIHRRLNVAWAAAHLTSLPLCTPEVSLVYYKPDLV